ncbi:amino acid/amide ABC transporter substrate-binding protein (HAAT family) [Pseudonocardia hierapolitana]|uniref:Amino acid/amide ABC transporter substrate-binding protein (HAAT family) n=1 Tax=Pseudonocardia hierapolitana TaxID=1128676 RepID=A0A561T0T2_9PSEU|nr:substrate-binding domain-containing protein [Pseudonocardia hierapolitana]TWF80707.1 amino acid/amide ABC transporter substrate-binding protein (HAAT family) [Pseudonocardia hierapolitana]
MGRDAVEIAFVVPRSGPAGIVGPSCEACGLLAADEINATGGLLGRELRLRIVDGGRAPRAVAREVDALVSAGAVEGVTGWHISAVRQVVAPVVSGRVPYVYSPLYEGGERTPGVFLAGETPDRQLLPALTWMAREVGVRTWCVVGDDYVWPIASARAARDYARRSADVDVVDEVFVPLGTPDFGPAVRRVERSGAQGVLMLLVGSDAVLFNRAFAAAGLDAACVRFSPLMEENMVLATGADATRDLYASAGFFEALPTASGLEFSRRYAERFGVDAPVLGSLGESCYEGVTLLARLAERAGSLAPGEWAAAADTLAYDSPRGTVRMTGNHLVQSVYLARADGLDLDVLAQLTP